MRYILAVCLFTIGLLSCNNKTEESKPIVKAKTLVDIPVTPDKIAGTYIGEFKGSPIAITLAFVSNGHVSGYNVHKGLKRNISGTMELVSGELKMQLSEPGNNPYDGQFNLSIDTSKWTGKGNWKPLKKGDEVNFTFEKQSRAVGEGEDPFNSIYLDEQQNAIQLRSDGTCTYSYLTDTTKTGQQVTIRGNYSMNRDSVLTIFWQNNDVFPSRKSTFRMKSDYPSNDSDFSIKILKGEGKEFSQMIF